MINPIHLCPRRPFAFDANPDKRDRKKDVKDWNEAVDRYFASGAEDRARLSVAQQSKLDAEGLPMFKYCGAEDCQNVEAAKSEKFKRCSQCRKIFYCSAGCQRGHWKAHKQVCKDPKYIGALMKSQVEFKQEVEDVFQDALLKVRAESDLDELMRGDLLDVAALSLLTKWGAGAATW